MPKQSKYRIALPKGSLFHSSRELLKQADISFEMPERKLVFETNQQQLEVLMVRPSDVAVYVENGAADLGVVGSDVLGEQQPEVLTLAKLAYGYCDLVVAVPEEGRLKDIVQIPDYCRVATKFPHLAREFFNAQGIPVEIIELYGSIEIAPLTGLSEAIVDLVGTGRTLRENGLTRICTISKHSARIIANRVSWELEHAWISKLLVSLLKSS